MTNEFFRRFTGEQAGVSQLGVGVIGFCLVVFLLYCAYTDGTQGKIFNKATFPAMGLGLLLNWIFGGWAGLGWSAGGLLVGFAIQLLPYMLGLAKAGDVKLLMAVGALKGWAFVSFGFLYGAVAWSFIAIPTLWKKGELADVGRTIRGYVAFATVTQQAPDAPEPVAKKRYMPWGVGLSVGFFIALGLEIFLGKPFWFAFSG